MGVSFADLLRQHRLTAELTQEALAERAGLSVNGIQKLESGGTRPQRETLRRLVEALQLESDALLAFQASAEPAPRQRANGASEAAGTAADLPVPLTSFIGREREKDDIARLLSSTRMLTLTGVGGCGKTRLAIEVGRTVAARYSDGVRLVELAALVDPALVPQAVATALGVRETPTQPLLATLIGALKPRRMLLVLDNCEHLLDACAQVATRLLTACPELHIMAASREALGVVGEVNWRVPTLTVPPFAPAPEPGRLSEFEAVQLFVQRGQAFSTGFAITERNAEAIARVCNQLDGIPLALELAAALLRGLSVDEVAERLGQRFALLTDGSRAALPRQRTLQATIDWSYDLLTPADQQLFSRLSIFAGRWVLEAAEEVCLGGEIEREQVLVLLLHLVDKSLVIADEGPDGRQRYRLLDTLRQYGRERLIASGDEVAVQRRHAAYYSHLATQAEPELTGSHQTAWLDRLAFEEGELWAAVERLIGWGDIQSALRLAAVLGRFWQLHGQLQEGRRRLGTVLAAHGADEATLARAKVLDAAGALAMYQGDMAVTRALLKESLALYRQHDYQPGIAWVLFHIGWMCHDHYRDLAAKRFLRDALALFRSLDDRHGIARALNALGLVEVCRGEFEAAYALHEESLALSREVDDRWGIAWALTNFAVDHLTRAKLGLADTRVADDLFDEALAIWTELGERRHLAFTHMNMADSARVAGNSDLARRRLAHSIELFNELEDATGAYYALITGYELMWSLGVHELAVQLIATTCRMVADAGRMYLQRDQWTRQQLDESRIALGTERYEAAWTEGFSLPLPEAVARLQAALSALA